MNSKLSRLFALVLFCVLLCGILPAVSASAVEFELTKEEQPVTHIGDNGEFYVKNELVITEATPVIEDSSEGAHSFGASEEARKLFSVGEDEYANITFSTFEDLKALAAETYTDWTDAYYTGTSALVISEDIALPGNFGVIALNADILVEEGVTASVQFIYGNNITVNGSLTVENTMTVNNTLTVNGSVQLTGYNINVGNAIVGEEKISFSLSYASIYWQKQVSSIEEFVAVVKEAENTTNPRYQYEMNIIDSSITVSESISLPYNVQISLQSGSELTIAEGCTLTLNSGVYASGKIIVDGALVNNAYLAVYYDRGGLLTINDSGSCFGSGSLGVFSDTLTTPDAAVPGLNLANCTVTEYNDHAHYWEIRSLEGLTQLGAPSELQWGYATTLVWNAETGTDEQTLKEVPGYIRWKAGDPDQNQAYIEVYREGEDSPVDVYHWSFGSDTQEYHEIDSFLASDLDSGSYYFTVRSIGDYITYYDSETVTSDVWTYTKPNAKLDTPTNPTWEWPYACSDNVENAPGYEVAFYYAATPTATPYEIGGTRDSLIGSGYRDSRSNIPNDYVQQNGDGYYYFKVRALSADITAICNSEWSELSSAYNLVQNTEEVKGELDTIIENSSLTTEEIKAAVNAIDNTNLKTAMLADQDDSGVVAQIAELETAVGVDTVVAVSGDAPAIDQTKVSIVGAGLNTLETEGEDITLNIGAAEEGHVIPELYDSTVAVSFSMDLDNVANTEELEVPVKITLPIPETINPNFLVILHYHVDGTMEEIRPYIYTENGQVYAAFVLTSFSDFIMTQTAQSSDVPMVNPFTDVKKGEFYYDSVLWAVNKGITNGYGSDTIFAPDQECTRGQIVTFLWRAAGEPAPASSKNPFKDVKASEFYYKAVLWAVEEGITDGYGSATTFCPDRPCTRGEIVTFLHRYFGKPAPKSTNNPFTDVSGKAFYYDAVLWAVEQGITNGYGSDTIFNPDGDCTRGQIVTFLYRAMA